MVVGRVMGAGTGKHTILMKLVEGSADYMDILCGVARDGAPCNEKHFRRNSTVGWFMNSGTGSLWGNSKGGDDESGEIKLGQILTMQVDTDAGTVYTGNTVELQPWAPWEPPEEEDY